MTAEHTADDILIDLDAKSKRDLLRNFGDNPSEDSVVSSHGVDQIFLWSVRARTDAAKTTLYFRSRSTGGDAAGWKASEQ